MKINFNYTVKIEKEKKASFNKPVVIDDYQLPVFNLTETRSKKCDKEFYSKVLTLCDLLKYSRSNNKCTVIALPTTSKRLKSIFGSQQLVSRAINRLMVMGIISPEDETYQYNGINEKYNKSKTYRWYWENEKIFRDYCKENGINIYINDELNFKNFSSSIPLGDTNNINNLDINKQYIPNSTKVREITSFDNKSTKFSSKLHFMKPDNFSKDEFENYLMTLLYMNYPELSKFQRIADQINQNYYLKYPQFKIKYRPKFKWNPKAVKGISIRATNHLCNAKKNKDEETKPLITYKDDVLKEHGLNLEKDVKSSVPRVTYLLNKGEWLDESIDIYLLIQEEFDFLKSSNPLISDCDLERETIKALFMRCYFDGSDGQLGNHFCREHGIYDEEERECCYAALATLRKAIKAVIGDTFYDNEIFFHESNIYLTVLLDLLEEGYFVWQVYDSWYARKDGVSQEEYEKHVTALVEKRANEYISNLK